MAVLRQKRNEEFGDGTTPGIAESQIGWDALEQGSGMNSTAQTRKNKGNERQIGRRKKEMLLPEGKNKRKCEDRIKRRGSGKGSPVFLRKSVPMYRSAGASFLSKELYFPFFCGNCLPCYYCRKRSSNSCTHQSYFSTPFLSRLGGGRVRTIKGVNDDISGCPQNKRHRLPYVDNTRTSPISDKRRKKNILTTASVPSTLEG